MTTATVSESESLAYCGVTLDGSDKGAIYTVSLSRAELEAYRRHRDTFLGVPSQRKTETKTLLDLYDFFHESYRQTPKDKLLEFMKTWPNQQHLDTLGQPELASLCAEGIAVAAWKSANKGRP